MHRVAYQYRAAKTSSSSAAAFTTPSPAKAPSSSRSPPTSTRKVIPAASFKHGPNALVAEGAPLVMIATVDHADPDSVQRYEKVLQLMRDMREQHASILAIANTGDETVASLADHTVFVNEMREPLLAICETIPFRLLDGHQQRHQHQPSA